MNALPIKQVSKGDFIKRKVDSHKVYIKGEYDRSLKGYWVIDTEDISRALIMKGSKIVFNGFTY